MPTYTDRLKQVVFIPGGSGGTIGTYNLTADESGTHFVTSGNMSTATFNLPNAQAGLEYTFTVGQSPSGPQTINVKAATGEWVNWPFFNTTFYTQYSLSGFYHSLKVRAIDDSSWYTVQNFGGISIS